MLDLDPLKPLAGCGDAASLTGAIQALCAQSGVVAGVDIMTLTRSGKRQALCFLRVDPAQRTGQLMSTPGLVRFGNELLLVVELPAAQPD
jgi:hypothetical protein